MEAGISTVHPPSTSNGDDHHDQKKRLSSVSSSSSSDTSFFDLQVDAKVRHVRSMPLADEPSPSAPTEGLGTSLIRDDSLKESPSGGGARASDEITPYKLPSYIFSKMKSGSPNDWSINSNESLFSIYMGNASFNKDFGKDGEANLASTSSGKQDSNNNIRLPPPLEQSEQLQYSPITDSFSIAAGDNLTGNGCSKDEEVVETQASVSEGAQFGSPSRISNSSSVSFVFPILTEKDNKSISGVMKKVKTGSEMTDVQHEPTIAESPKTQVTPPESVVRGRGWTKWLSCFSCWSSSRPNGA